MNKKDPRLLLHLTILKERLSNIDYGNDNNSKSHELPTASNFHLKRFQMLLFGLY